MNIQPFTEQATEHEAKVMRLMVYMLAFSDDYVIGGSIDNYNETFEIAEEVLDRLGGNSDDAIMISMEGDSIYLLPSDDFEDVLIDVVSEYKQNQL